MIDNENESFRKRLEELRKRLLNLTNKHNPLLNIRHSEQSTRHIRVIDHLPDALYQRIQNGNTLTFRALPELKNTKIDLPDECTETFLNHYREAKITDEQYINSMKQLEEKDDKYMEHYTIDRQLRDRVRVRLGLPLLFEPEPLTNWDLAKKAGMNPSYELSKPESGISQEVTSYIQTRLRGDELQVKLDKLNKHIRDGLNESGVNTFYAAFGFLERYESKDSDRPFFAPLILQQLKPMQRKAKNRKAGGEWQYSVMGDDESPQLNIALVEKLRSKLVLPEFELDECPEDYFKKVEQAIVSEEKWRVRRWITFGMFNFSGHIMYQDLDPDNWNKPYNLLENTLIEKFVSGANEKDRHTYVYDTAETYDIDKNPDVQKYAPKLILNADSSQHSAIVDSMRGNDVAIKGPPGTGKSQTIVNLIANAIFAGKTVLFVAQKKAALDVVHKRISRTGLGEFCLPIHSEKATVGGIKEELKLAINARSTFTPVSKKVKECNEKVTSLRTFLRDYADALSAEFGMMNQSVFRSIWKRLDIQEMDNIITPSIKRIVIEDVENITRVMFEEYLRELDDIEKLDAMKRKYDTHPWDGVSAVSNDKYIAYELPNKFEECLHAIEILQNFLISMTEDSSRKEYTSLCEIERIVDTKSKISKQNILEANYSMMLGILTTDEYRSAVEEFYAEQCKWIDLKNECESVVKNVDTVLAGKELAVSMIDSAKSFGIAEVNIENIRLRIDRKNKAIEVYDGLKANLDQYARRVFDVAGNTLTLGQYDGLKRFVDAYRVKGVECGQCNYVYIFENCEELKKKIDNMVRSVEWISSKEEELSKVFRMDYKHSIYELRFVLQELNNSSMFSLLKKRYRSAKQIYSKLRRPGHGEWKHSQQSIKEIEEMLNLIQQRDSCGSDECLKKAFGALIRGTNTNFEMIRGVMKDVDEISKVFSNSNEDREKAKRYFIGCLDNNVDEIQQIVDLVICLNEQNMFKTNGNDSNVKLKHIIDNRRQEITELSKLRMYLMNTVSGNELTYNDLRELVFSKASVIQMQKNAMESQEEKLLRKSAEYGVVADCDWVVVSATLKTVQLIVSMELNHNFWNVSTPTELEHKIKMLHNRLEKLEREVQETKDVINETWSMGSVDSQQYIGYPDYREVPLSTLKERILKSLDAREALGPMVELASYEKRAEEEGLHYAQMLSRFKQNGLTYENARSIFEYLYYLNVCKEALRTSALLSPDELRKKQSSKNEFAKLDEQYLENCCLEIQEKHRRTQLPEGSSTGRKRDDNTEMRLVRHVIEKNSRIKLRKLILNAGQAIQILKPCLLMSPASVAKYIAPDGIKFDIAIIDEASQMPLEEAIGTLARCRNVVVVGDREQLPPGRHFKQQQNFDIDYEESDTEESESILETAFEKCSPVRNLIWHYRSKHESLIAFSNTKFYNRELIIYPSATTKTKDFGVVNHYVKGEYSSGRNAKEVDAVRDAARNHMMKHPEKSLGIVTMNVKQMQLIENEMDLLFNKDENCEKYREKWQERLESFFVKNLENVQGDERDVMMISTVYGPDSYGRVKQQFGPINSKYGYRRLNVLFTRAKHSLHLFTSMTPNDIRVQDSKSSDTRGLEAFREYLEYAETGKIPGENSKRSPDSEFEISVINELREHGYIAEPQVGEAGYFIDIGVKHKNWKYGYILGVECDGSTYHSSKSARDSDRLRQSVLEKQGWKIYRIWSTDWFYSYEREMKKLVDEIEREYRKKISEKVE